MNQITIAPLLHPYWKIIGLVISTVAIITAFILTFLPAYTDNSLEIKDLSTWATVLGFFFFTFTREKEENDQIRNIRHFAFRLTFLVLFNVFILISLQEILNPEDAGITFLFPAIVGVITYFLAFNITLLNYSYSEEIMKKIPWIYIIWFSVLTIALVTTIFINN